jgi:ribosomal protein L32
MQFRLVGQAWTAIELTCSRCLEGFEMPVAEAFDVLYLPHTPAGTAEERMIEDDDLSTAFYEDSVIDLGQLMQEQCYLAVPMKPLCQESCRGLCPDCGTNLNTARAVPADVGGPAAGGARPTAQGQVTCQTKATTLEGPDRSAGPDALKAASLGACPHCHEAKAAHQICPQCGYYRGRQVREIKEA